MIEIWERSVKLLNSFTNGKGTSIIRQSFGVLGVVLVVGLLVWNYVDMTPKKDDESIV